MALRDQPYLPLFVEDFLTDEKLNECSANAHGVYIKIMCLMHKSETYGVILLEQKWKQNDKQIINFASKFARHMPFNFDEILSALNELIFERVLFLEDDRLIQRRMVRDNEISITRATAGFKGGKATQFAQANNKANIEANNQAKYQANNQANTVIENENEIVIKSNKKKKGAPVKKLVLTMPFTSEKFLTAWEIWRQYKLEQHKFSYKSLISEQAALNDLVKISHGGEAMAIELIYYAIAKGWKGIYRNETYEKDKQHTGATGQELTQLLAKKLGVTE